MGTTVISAKVDREKERPLIRTAAETEGLSVSAYIRYVVVRDARQKLAELARVER